MPLQLRVLLLALLLLPMVAESQPAQPGTAGYIAQRAFDLYGGDDAYSRLHFTFETDGARETRLSLLMGFKRGGGKDLDYRVIMFNEYPPDTRDIGFLGLFFRPDAGKEDEMWLYLPELRQSRRLTQHSQEHHHHGDHAPAEDVVDEFTVSELDHEELMPRWPGLDTHRLRGQETIEGREVDVIESVPIDPATSAYGRRIQWISRDDGLPLRIEYHDARGDRVKTQTLSWQQVGDAWVWDRVTAVNHVRNARTVLEQTDVRINRGLPDNLFTRRALGLGARAFESRATR